MIPTCEICGKELAPIEDELGLVLKHPELSIVGENRIACVAHIKKLTAKIEAEKAAQNG
jgi:hypothetical protein